jgi:hypothetical protein
MPLHLTLDPVQPVPAAELDVLKGRLLDWARANSRLDAASLRENLLPLHAEKVPVYEFYLTTLLETRLPELRDVVREYQEGAPSATAPTGPLDLWKHEVAVPAEYKESKSEHPVPESFQSTPCAVCASNGVLSCKACHGMGQTACPNCQGSGSRPCDYCKGFGKSDCLKCGGKGVSAGGAAAKPGDACEACQGGGKVPCARCRDGNVACDVCRSAGRGRCAACQGKGSGPCGACAGKGKILIGKAFRAEFRPVRFAGSAALEKAPKDAVERALKDKAPGGESEVRLDAAELSSADLPDPVRMGLADLLRKLDPVLSEKTRPARQKLSWLKSEAVRVSGTCFDQEFIYWFVPADGTVVPERDPLRDLGATTAAAAQAAWDAADWARSLALARKTLSYDRENPVARDLLAQWRGKVLKEALTFGGAAALLAGGSAAAWILLAEKGLHKAGPALNAFGAVAAAGALGAAASGFLGRLLPSTALRRAVLFLAASAVAAGAGLGARAGLGWNGVRDADRAALAGELAAKFPNGVGEVYWQPDLDFLESVGARYAASQADLSGLEAMLEKQRSLKRAQADRVTEFHARLEALAADPALTARVRKERIVALRDLYALQSVDVSAADAKLKELEALASREKEAPRGRLSIRAAPPRRR